MKYTLRLTGLSSRKDDFVFRFNGRDVGRTYADGTPVGPRWYWSIYGINLRGPLLEGVVVQGLADDLSAAKAAFRANWEKLLAAGTVKALSDGKKRARLPVGEHAMNGKLAHPNQKILEYLHQYCDQGNFYDFAVLLRGKWGAGKTYLILEQFVKEREGRQLSKNLYVSLYGVSSLRQIDNEFYRKLHPILSSKGMKFATALVKGLVKTAVRVDLDANGKDDVQISSSIPDVDWGEYFSSPGECVLIFDDLERCALPPAQILGYINQLVEHEKFRVIILANEEEILKREGKEQYEEMKEKTIGQTLTVRSTVLEALPTFVELIRDEKTKNYLQTQNQEIQALHAQSGTENLRLLKQALWDFERLASKLADKHWENKEAIGILFRVVISLSFEVRSGRINEEHLRKFAVGRWDRLMRDKDEPTLMEVLDKRYPEVDFYQTLLIPDHLKALLFDGWVDENAIQKNLDESAYYTSPASLPAWKAAWHGWDLVDADYEDAVSRVEEGFKNREFVIKEELFHVFGLRLYFSKVGVIPLTSTDVVQECMEYLEDLRRSGRFPDPFEDLEDGFSRDGWQGLGYMERESDEFRTILQRFDETSAQVRLENLPRRAANLLLLMKEDAQKYFLQLCPNNVESATYYDIPILAYMNPDAFVDAVISLQPSAQTTVFITFKARYETGRLGKSLRDEVDWLRNVTLVLRTKLPSLGKMSRHRLETLAKRNLEPYALAVVEKE